MSSTTPLFSIIVPIYNVELYLPRCLDSILSQTFVDFEVICINDNSPDWSHKILENYAKMDSRIKIITFNKNKGISAARNKGLELAKGKYIQFVDSDDYLDEYALKVIYDKMEKDSSDICIFSYRNIKNDSRWTDYTIQNYLREFADQPHLFNSMKKIFFFDGYTWMRTLRKTFWEKYKIFFPEHIALAEDMCFWTQIEYRATHISLLDCPCYNYIHHSNSASRKKNAVAAVIEAYKYTSSVMPENFKMAILTKGYDVACWYNNQIRYKDDSTLDKYEEEIKNISSKIKYPFKTRTKVKKYLHGLVVIKNKNDKTVLKLLGIELFKRKTTSGYNKFYLLGLCYKKENLDA